MQSIMSCVRCMTITSKCFFDNYFAYLFLFLLLQSGGTVMAKVTGNPVNATTHGIHIPYTSIISGTASFVQDIKDHIKDTIHGRSDI